MTGKRNTWGRPGARFTTPAATPTPAAAVAVPRVTFGSRADGGTITVILTQSIAGLGAKGDVLTLVQNAEVDALFALGWAALYTGTTPPVVFNTALIAGPQTLTSGQQTQVQANLGLPALLSTFARVVSTDGTGGLDTPTGVGAEMVITASGLQDIRFNGVSL